MSSLLCNVASFPSWNKSILNQTKGMGTCIYMYNKEGVPSSSHQLIVVSSGCTSQSCPIDTFQGSFYANSPRLERSCSLIVQCYQVSEWIKKKLVWVPVLYNSSFFLIMSKVFQRTLIWSSLIIEEHKLKLKS